MHLPVCFSLAHSHADVTESYSHVDVTDPDTDIHVAHTDSPTDIGQGDDLPRRLVIEQALHDQLDRLLQHR